MNDDFSYEMFIEALPTLFASAMQKATMSTLLWNNLDAETIIFNLRLYDLVRRLHNVKLGHEGFEDDLMPLFMSVQKNEEMMEFFMTFVRSGKFPDTTIIKMIHDV
jgi:hypothetical protein